MSSETILTDEDKYQAFRQAAESAGSANVRRLIAEWNRANEILIEAIEAGDIEGVKRAIADGAKMDWPNDYEYPAFYAVGGSAGDSSLEILKIMIAAGVPVDQVGEESDDQLIHHAASSGRIELVQFLISLGADVNVTDKEGCQPIHYAVHGGHRAMVEFLLGISAKISYPSESCWSPLHYAAAHGDMEKARQLIADGALVNQREESEHFLPMHVAAMHGRMAMVRFLVDAGSELDAVCMRGLAAQMALDHGYAEVAVFLEGASGVKR